MYKKPVQADDTFWRLEVSINPGKLDDIGRQRSREGELRSDALRRSNHSSLA
jgi:hypothetical protein